MKQNFFRKSVTTLAGFVCLLNGSVEAYSFLPCEPSWLLLIGGEALYWTVDQDNLDFAMDVSKRHHCEEVVGPGDVHFLKYDWKGGARGWIGLKGESCWDVRAVYTYYKNNSNKSIHATGEDALWATLVHPATVRSEATSASARNNLTYQTVDLLVGNEFSFCCDKFVVHPYFGLRGLQLEQKFKTLYEGGEFVSHHHHHHQPHHEPRPGQVNFNSDLKAGGLHTGINFSYYLVKGFGFYGGFAGSLLAGNTTNHQTQKILNPNGSIHEILVDIHEKENVLIPGCNLSIGINWESCFDYGNHMVFSFGYEFHEWFNTPEYRRFSDFVTPGVSAGNRGNIGLHGANVSLVLFF